jgi:two-component system, LytTR family, response regulator
MTRCVIIDDKPLAIDILIAYIEKVPWLELAFTTGSPLEALEYLRTKPADLLFLDIQMPDLNGFELIKLIGAPIPVVLTTAYANYALDGYSLDVVDYLLKPIPFDRFYQAVEKARARNTLAAGPTAQPSGPNPQPAGPTTQSIFVKTEYRIQRIALDDILFIEARQNYVAIETRQGRIMSLQNIKSMEEKLPSAQFVRVHKSFIVALQKIDTIERSTISIGNTAIPIGDSYREQLFKRLGT